MNFIMKRVVLTKLNFKAFSILGKHWKSLPVVIRHYFTALLVGSIALQSPAVLPVLAATSMVPGGLLRLSFWVGCLFTDYICSAVESLLFCAWGPESLMSKDFVHPSLCCPYHTMV